MAQAFQVPLDLLEQAVSRAVALRHLFAQVEQVQTSHKRKRNEQLASRSTPAVIAHHDLRIGGASRSWVRAEPLPIVGGVVL